MSPRRSSPSCLPIVLLTLLALGLVAVLVYVPVIARRSFGRPSPSLNILQRFDVACSLVWNANDLTQPRDSAGVEQMFVIAPGENVTLVANHLQLTGLIRNASTFRLYLVWSGLDAHLQPGTYRLSPAMSAVEIAHTVVSASMTEATLVVFPGWRMEEVAAALPTSGLDIAPDAFLAAASAPGGFPDLLPAGASAEGFLAPGEYSLPRATTADQLVSVLLQRFEDELTPDLKNGFAANGLTLYQAVTLASIVEREAMVDDEMPRIASVFYNRLAIGMLLQTDPTVQYAIGYNAAQGTWWTNPLSVSDLQIDSPYNTYLYPGLPPGPISNPGTAALMAVAFPEQTNYYFFQARCDGSGLHNFAETFELHQQNNCP